MATKEEIDECILDLSEELGLAFENVNIKCGSDEKMLDMMLTIFSKIKDPRKPGMITYSLANLLAIYIYVAISKKKPSFNFVATYVKVKPTMFKRLGLIDGKNYPSHDTFERIFKIIDPKQMKMMVTSNLSRFWERVEDKLLPSEKKQIMKMGSFDGQEMNATGRSEHSKKPSRNYNVLNFYSNTYSYAKGTEIVDNKTNEIPTAQNMLKRFDLTNTVLTSDALHCQYETARIIVKKKGHYVLKVKSNQLALKEKVVKLLDNSNQIEKISYNNRDYEILFLKDHIISPEWPGAIAAIKMKSHKRDEVDKNNPNREPNTHYFISSLNNEAPIVRSIDRRWEIEGGFHWTKDVKLNQDMMRCRDINVAENINILNGFIFSLYKIAGKLLGMKPSHVEIKYSDNPLVLIGFVCQYFVGRNLSQLFEEINRRKPRTKK